MPQCNYAHRQTPIPNSTAKKNISGSLRVEIGSHLSFTLDAPGQKTPPAFEGRRESFICITILNYEAPTGGGGRTFHLATACSCWESFQNVAKGKITTSFQYKKQGGSSNVVKSGLWECYFCIPSLVCAVKRCVFALITPAHSSPRREGITGTLVYRNGTYSKLKDFHRPLI